MMKQAQEMQERLQREMSELSAQGNAGGGMVTVTVNGSNEVPVATVTPASGAEDSTGIPVTLSGGDVDGGVASFTVTALPAVTV